MSRELVMEVDESQRPPPRKRESKGEESGKHTADLNIPVETSNALVSTGLVKSRLV